MFTKKDLTVEAMKLVADKNHKNMTIAVVERVRDYIVREYAFTKELPKTIGISVLGYYIKAENVGEEVAKQLTRELTEGDWLRMEYVYKPNRRFKHAHLKLVHL